MKEERLQLASLEKEVMRSFLEKNNIEKNYFGEDFESVVVVGREMTGSGFVTDLQTDKSFKDVGIKSSRWGKIGATLNETMNVSFVVYVDNFMLSGIEGFTYGDALWPSAIISFKMRELRENEF